MGNASFETMRKRISEELSPRIKEFRRTVSDISANFRNLGLEAAVWHPDRIHRANLGGIDADSYVGYSRIEGKWGLMIRIIEHDHDTHAFVGQRVLTIESCGNMEITANALKKVRELLAGIREAMEQQTRAIEKPDPGFAELRNPDSEL